MSEERWKSVWRKKNSFIFLPNWFFGLSHIYMTATTSHYLSQPGKHVESSVECSPKFHIKTTHSHWSARLIYTQIIKNARISSISFRIFFSLSKSIIIVKSGNNSNGRVRCDIYARRVASAMCVIFRLQKNSVWVFFLIEVFNKCV